MTFSDFGLRPVDGVNIAILLVLAWILVRILHSDANTVQAGDFISSPGAGRDRGDLNKLLQLGGGVAGILSALMFSAKPNVDGFGLAAVLTVVLGFCAGPAVWSATLRSRQGQVETTKTVDYAQPTSRTETTTTGPTP